MSGWLTGLTVKGIRTLLIAAALWFLTIYLLIAYFHLKFPFELEFTEGFSVDVTLRILEGRKIFVEPSLEFAPPVYGFLYYYLSAIVSAILGAGFMPLRLVSFFSSLGAFWTVFYFVKKETGSHFAGFLSVGLFAAAYRICDWWFDIAMVDSLFVFWLLLSIYCARFSETPKGYALGGVFLALSFLTKQPAIILFFPMGLYCFLAGFRKGFAFAAAFLCLAGVVTLLMNWAHEGWYAYFLFELPFHHTRVPRDMMGAFIEELVKKMPLALLFLLSVIFISRGRADRRRLSFYSLIGGGMIAESIIAISHLGSSLNSLYPACAILSISFGVYIGLMVDKIRRFFREAVSLFWEGAVYALCVAQFAWLLYDPLPQIPGKLSIEKGWAFVRFLKSIEGEVYVPFHGYLPVLAGKKSLAHGGYIWDVLRGQKGPIEAKLRREIRDAFESRRFAAIVLPVDPDPVRRAILEPESYFWWEKAGLDEFYVRRHPVYQAYGVTEYLYLPRSGNSG